MPSGKAIPSRSKCPLCGGPLYYVPTSFFSFLTGKKKRVCIDPNCDFVDTRRFKVVVH